MKPKEKVKLYLDPAGLNETLIKPVHKGLPLNGIFANVTNAKLLSFIDATSVYITLKVDEIS